MRTRKAVVVGVVVGLLGLSAVASAGYKYDGGVARVESSWATGALGAVRASGDSNQYIGCDVTSYPGYSYALCYARNADWTKYLTCTSNDPKIVEAATALTTYTYLQFDVNSSGNCTQLYVSNSSYWRPIAY